MDAHDLEATEKVSASRKLGKKDAAALLESASRLVVAKGKNVREWTLAPKKVPSDAIEAMLGPTGNLRAPTVRTGKTILVGFNEEAYARYLT